MLSTTSMRVARQLRGRGAASVSAAADKMVGPQLPAGAGDRRGRTATAATTRRSAPLARSLTTSMGEGNIPIADDLYGVVAEAHGFGQLAYGHDGLSAAFAKRQKARRARRVILESTAEWMRNVGETPLVHLPGDANVFAKLEGHNPGASIKDRALSAIVAGLVKEQRLDANDGTLVLVTSGSAGVSLSKLHNQLRQLEECNFDILVVMPEAYSQKPVPAEIIRTPGMRTYHGAESLLADLSFRQRSGQQRTLLLDGVFMDVLAETRAMAAERGWTMLDQHYDANGLDGHKDTANEIMKSLPNVTDVVCTTGTGATAAGLRKWLPKNVRVHARPSASGAIDGLSNINRYDNFCNAEMLEGYTKGEFDKETAFEMQQHLEDEYGIVAGPSTGAAYSLAREVRAERGEGAVIAVIAADGTLAPGLFPSWVDAPMGFDSVGTKPAWRTASSTSSSAASSSTFAEGLGAGLARLGVPTASADSTMVACTGCGHTVDAATDAAFGCPNRDSQPHVDHVLAPVAPTSTVSLIDSAASADADSVNPFIHFRHDMLSHRVALSTGMTDAEYVKMVESIDERLVDLDGSGFRETPLLWDPSMNCFFKVEVGNVAQSHKARHLMNVMVYLQVLRAGNPELKLGDRRLAVASCGNAGLAAAVVAAAANWPIDVCIPPDADESVKSRLAELGADVHICSRDSTHVETVLGRVATTEAADPTLSVSRSLVRDHGSIPFSVQGPDCGLAVEGGQTLAWELLAGLSRMTGLSTGKDIGNVFVQVGGGALGAGLTQGIERAVRGGYGGVLRNPTMRYVQAEGNAPLARAFDRVRKTGVDAFGAAQKRDEYMFPWENPASVAHGILDDETYDWVALVDSMLASTGATVVVPDDKIIEATEYARTKLGVNVCTTGASGLAGLLTHREAAGASESPDIVVLSGLNRE